MPYLAVAIGGFVGACLRFFISQWLGTTHGFPIATLLINISGSAFLAWFYTLTLERFSIHPHVRLGVGTGMVGAFTTYSTFTLETWKLVQAGFYVMGITYVALSFVGGLCTAFIGYWIAMKQSRLRVADTANEEM